MKLPFDHVWVVPSDSRPDVKHVVINHGDHWLCSCEDYKFTAEPSYMCKHIAKIISDALDWPLDHRRHLVRA
jgi:hypothetical protein